MHVGRWGSRTSSTSPSCDGECEAGWFCPASSTSSRALPCKLTSVFCRAGAALPQAVQSGYYSVAVTVNATTTAATDTKTVRVDERMCESGYACMNGQRRACVGGSYTNVTGSTSCMLCSPGFYSSNTASSETGLTTCIACDFGTYASSAGSTYCAACPSATRRAQSHCTICLPGMATTKTQQQQRHTKLSCYLTTTFCHCRLLPL